MQTAPVEGMRPLDEKALSATLGGVGVPMVLATAAAVVVGPGPKSARPQPASRPKPKTPAEPRYVGRTGTAYPVDVTGTY